LGTIQNQNDAYDAITEIRTFRDRKRHYSNSLGKSTVANSVYAEKFPEVGSGNAVLAKINAVLQKFETQEM
jgi:hypothetical protein